MFELRDVDWAGRLRAVSVTLRPGQRVALIGPNGAGKSSLLALMAGQRAPDTGGVWLHGRPLAGLSAAAQARFRAWLPQAAEVGAPLTGEQLLSLGRLPGMSLDQERFDEIVAVLELAPLLARPLPMLSGGECQRLQLGRVLVQAWALRADHPRALLLDEALAPLDVRHRMRLLAALRDGCGRGELALVWSTHDLNEALMHADHVWLLQDGELMAAGETAVVMTPERLSAVFQWPIERLQTPQGPVLRAKTPGF